MDEVIKEMAEEAGLEFTGGNKEIREPVTSTDALGNLSVIWEDDGLQVQVNEIERGRRDLSCYLSIREIVGKKARWVCAPVRINLMSDSAKTGLRRSLNDRKPLDWASRIDQVVVAVHEAAANQRSVTVLKRRASVTEQNWLEKPVLEMNQHSMLVAAGGTGKSMLSLALCVSAVTNTPLLPGVEVAPFDKNALYLDWETDEETHEVRTTQLCEGAGVPFPDDRIHYIRMTVPLSQDVQYLYEYIIKNNIGLVVVDSVGMATGGDMNSQGDAIAYVSACRALGEVTVLSIHHVGWGEQGRNTGSRYFENAARSVWVLEKDQETDSPESHLDLTHRKANNGIIRPPIGMRVEFGQATRYYSDTVTADKQGTAQQIKDVLSIGKLPLLAIYEDLDQIPKATIRKNLERMEKRGEVQKFEGSSRKNPEYGLSVTPENRHGDVTDRGSVTREPPKGGFPEPSLKVTPDLGDSKKKEKQWWLEDNDDPLPDF